MIEFKEYDIANNASCPMIVHDSIDHLKTSSRVKCIIARNFVNVNTGERHATLRISNDHQHGSGFVLRATGDKWYELPIVQRGFETIDAAIEYVNENYSNQGE